MRKIGILILSVVALIALGSSAYAAGIATTKHNLALNGTGTGNITGQSKEICIYCHTPHGGSTDAPLWNRMDQGVAASYTLYDSRTFDATFADTSAPTGVSKACLSCHDGTLGVNQLRNLPGSGFGSPPTPDTTLTAAGLSNPAAFIDTDLTNDHPVSMKYDTALSPGTGGAIGENTHASGFRAESGTSPKFVVDGTGSTGVILPLYTADKLVQCASCHDPHQDTTSTVLGEESVAFLRVANTGSQLCLTCHLK
ncbi:MAG: cytochrome c3 family protein [Candidatus Binatia bacterium]